MNWWTFHNTILLWYHFVCCTMCSPEIYVYLKLWILSSRNICSILLLCAGIFLKDFLLHVWLNATLQYYLWHDICLYYSALDLILTRLHYWVLHDVNYSHWPCAPGTWYFMRNMCCISTWCHDIHLLRALQELYIYACHAVYFYMMSAIFTYYVLSRNLIFYVRLCCIFLHDVIDINLLWAVQELDILCATVLYISTWCHWRPSTVSSRGTGDIMCVSVICQRHDFITHFGCREKYTCYIDAVYISTLCSTSLYFIMMSEVAYFLTGMCIFGRTWCWVSLMTPRCWPVTFECEHV